MRQGEDRNRFGHSRLGGIGFTVPCHGAERRQLHDGAGQAVLMIDGDLVARLAAELAEAMSRARKREARGVVFVPENGGPAGVRFKEG